MTKIQDNPRVRFGEKAGNKFKDILCKSNPWAKSEYGRADCPLCKQQNGKQLGNCRKEGVTYKITCKRCKNQGKEVIYWGESSRSFYERGKEHLDGQMNENDNNPLYKHDTNDHDSIKQEYTIEVI